MSQHEATDADLLWGVASIARHINQPIRKTRYLIQLDAIPTKKLGARIIVASKRALDQALGRAGGEG
jgi:hypothetical protein